MFNRIYQMKNALICFLTIPVLFFSCKKDSESEVNSTLTVEQKNRAVVIYFGEDWCIPCQYFGVPTFDSCLKYEGSILTGIKLNSTSQNNSLNCNIAAGAFQDFVSGVFSAGTIPSCAVNNVESVISIDIANNATDILNKAISFQQDSVIAGLALDKVVVGYKVQINTKVKFFKSFAAGNDFTLGLYIVEDNLIMPNIITSAGLPLVYRNQVRMANSSYYYGTTINDLEKIDSNQEFTKTTILYLNTNWDKNKLKVVGIIWKKGTTPATVVNSNVVM